MDAELFGRVLAFTRRPLVREAVRDTLPLMLGTAAWGLFAGVALANSSVGVPLSIFMSVLTYAGSAQIAVLPLIATDAPMWVVWSTTICVSLRFVVFSFHLRPYFAHLPLTRRMVIGFFMGDTSFALFLRRFPQAVPGCRHDDYFLGSALLSFVVWQCTIVTGILAGSRVPPAWGLGFAGTMALLALTCAQLRGPSALLASVAAACAAVVAFALPLKLNILVAISVGVTIGILIDRVRCMRAGNAS